MVGPMARARLEPDCIIPSELPCLSSGETFDARLVRAGEAIALPSDRKIHVRTNANSPPAAGPTKGIANRLAHIVRHPAAASGVSPNRITRLPNKTPWPTTD